MSFIVQVTRLDARQTKHMLLRIVIHISSVQGGLPVVAPRVQRSAWRCHCPAEIICVFRTISGQAPMRAKG